ncbi:MAG TPA: VOC family protein [Thermoanaerobaculia bacterium]|jgi:catechol 2,3-dioxygenase-like lactoylglutathione lyase family enzyme|nr:VOC family protein [Thermoanaerobaculia bacterium]
MLGDKDAVATLAVKDIEVARKFYEGKLGLKPATDTGEPTTLTYESGRSRIFVYESKYAGTNQATALNWLVGDDINGIVKDLGAKGVTFEHYDGLPDTTREGDVHVAGDLRLAWFKDPDGNILALLNR